ncbi:MAG: transcriptional regulator [Alphaproteobacteria bacterium]|nr:transcriptional regulator [Alphaproteobacteria bacterium]
MYRYRESGLDNVWLVNGYKIRSTPYGKAVAVEDVEGLHKSIAESLVGKPGPLTRAEFRFLRKELALSQKALGGIIGADEQAIARWERGVSRVDEIADRFLRALYRETKEGKAGIRALVRRLNEPDDGGQAKIKLRRGREDWKVAA